MLTQIDIINLATIQKLHVELAAGTTVITGETGAGKSVLIDAIELALGGRGTGDFVRQGSDKADISLTFVMRELPEIQSWLQQHDLENDGDECIIRRTLSRDGRSKSYINNIPTTLQVLRELSDLLINIHGQHEHQALFQLATQRDMLDKYAGHLTLTAQVAALSHEWHGVQNILMGLRTANQEQNSRSEFLRFQLLELEELQLKSDEFRTLDMEHKQLANAGALLENLDFAINALADDDNHNAVRSLTQIMHALENIREFNPQVALWIESIKNALIQVNDVENEIRHYQENVDLDPERLQWIEQRIGTLFDMARKHKIAPEGLLALQEKIAAELASLDSSDARLAELTEQLQQIEKNYHAVAKKLSASRAKAAVQLAKEITAIIHELSLPHGQFKVHFATDDVPAFASFGAEKIVFQITTNVGQPLQPLAKVASGGELSRISLAIHMATAEQHTIPTLIFDEVDVGISGGTAEIVGKLLRRLGDTHQLLCITHSPQVSAQGHQHLLVAKRHEANASFTEMRFLTAKEKISELARMLGGVEITKKTLEHAREMVEKV
jgi:DNA repair protein RecN (Recombination protein N)